ncbi:MAG: transketolase [Deltaproteobacteria bacterium]|nr:MAG: transketolase [Deltaproteobacteria bacterium]
MKFPIDLSAYKPLKFAAGQSSISEEQLEILDKNIKIVRDSLVFFTALANCKGLGGHTGGAYDIVPELLIVDGFIKGSEQFYPVYFDEAGHRVAIQYMMAVLNGHMPEESLFHYREYDHGLYGHPELDEKNGIFFSSGRLGHLWSHVNGVAEAHAEQTLIMFGSDGSQMEGNDAEAARYAVARNLKVKLLIDDNDITITGHPSRYMPGYDIEKTLLGHGLSVISGDGEDYASLFARISSVLTEDGPAAVISKRYMAVGIDGVENTSKGHDVIPVDLAIKYLEAKGYNEAVNILRDTSAAKSSREMLGSTAETAKNRDEFGKIICQIMDTKGEDRKKILVVDSDLAGSCGLHHIQTNHPDRYVGGGIMERNNFSVAAGFGSVPGNVGIFGTFAAFQEMIISEATMARLNKANVIAHFSHSGVDDMADNTCHFGINNFFADNGLADDQTTRLYFPADALQLKAVLNRIFDDQGLRFIYSTRSATPFILDENGEKFYAEGYEFVPGRDEIIREGKDGYIISYGEMLYRSLDAVERLRAEGVQVGLINKPTLNLWDEKTLDTLKDVNYVLVVESQNTKTGLAARMGSWLLQNGLSPRFAGLGTSRAGRGGLKEQLSYQQLEPKDIRNQVLAMLG